jgi:peptide/nickel transport system permease protein
MHRYIMRRLLLAVPTIIGVTLLIFVTLRVIPGDPVMAMMGGEAMGIVYTDEQIAEMRHNLGLDRPLHVQYLEWMSGVVRLKFGTSFWRSQDIGQLILRRAPITIQMALGAIALSWLIGLPIGLVGAIYRNTLKDYATRVGVIFFMATPNFWIGLLMILITVTLFNWRPPFGIVYFWDNPFENLQLTIGPILAMGIGLSATTARITRSTVLEVLTEDYVRTARAKGLSQKIVFWRHVLRNALLPILTVSGVSLGHLLGGSVAVERAFSVPGLGLALTHAVNERDYMVIQNLVLLYAVVFVLVNLIVDVSYAFVDPRIRYE